MKPTRTILIIESESETQSLAHNLKTVIDNWIEDLIREEREYKNSRIITSEAPKKEGRINEYFIYASFIMRHGEIPYLYSKHILAVLLDAHAWKGTHSWTPVFTEIDSIPELVEYLKDHFSDTLSLKVKVQPVIEYMTEYYQYAKANQIINQNV